MTINAISEGSDAGQDGSLATIGLGADLRGALVRALLLAENDTGKNNAGKDNAGENNAMDLRYRMSVFGVDVDREYFAFRADPGPGRTAEQLAVEMAVADPVVFTSGATADLDGVLAGFLAAPPVQPNAGVVGIGPPCSPDRLWYSFQLATRALDVARAFALTGTHSFEGLGLLPTVLADADVGESLRRRYLQPLRGRGAAPEILTALRAYFDCDMQVDAAASALSLHPNTMRNRIRRFEELTGARLRDPIGALEVWWALRSTALAVAGPSGRKA